MEILAELTVVEAAAALRSGDIKAEDYACALLDRARDMAHLNAFVSIEPEAVLAASREADLRRAAGERPGPLHGVPICVKDNIETADLPTTGGTPALQGHHPKRNAPVATSLLKAGAILFGKTGMHELAFGVSNNNPEFGAVRNPYDLSRIPGGSSGGTGAAVGGRIVPAGLGTDTGGSVRIPAALCGAVGFRPTVKRWPQAGIIPISATRDTAGPVARSVDDVLLLDTIVTGCAALPQPQSLSGFRLGVARSFFWEDLDCDTERVCGTALELLKEAGATLVEVKIPGIATLDEAVSLAIVYFEARVHLKAYLSESGSSLTFDELAARALSPDVREILGSILDPAVAPSEEDYRAALLTQRPRLIEAYRRCFEEANLDALVFPTTPLPAAPIGDDVTVELNSRRVPTFATFIRNTNPGSGAGLPGVSLPAGMSRTGLPIGLALDGLPSSDRTLLGLARAIEGILPRQTAPQAR